MKAEKGFEHEHKPKPQPQSQHHHDHEQNATNQYIAAFVGKIETILSIYTIEIEIEIETSF